MSIIEGKDPFSFPSQRIQQKNKQAKLDEGDGGNIWFRLNARSVGGGLLVLGKNQEKVD
jgi:hypothetical protein